MYYVGICPLCEEGLLGIRACGVKTMVLCDECDALWSHPPEEGALPLMVQADPPCPECGESLWNDQAHWAVRSEIEAAGWWGQVVGKAGEREESGGPRTPDRIDPIFHSHDDDIRTFDSQGTPATDDSESA